MAYIESFGFFGYDQVGPKMTPKLLEIVKNSRASTVCRSRNFRAESIPLLSGRLVLKIPIMAQSQFKEA